MSKLNIAIVDYGVGNTSSVHNAIGQLGYNVSLTADKDALAAADALVLPGVGSFGAALENLDRNGLKDTLNELVLGDHKPIIGICLGMQLMATASHENGHHAGFDWIPGVVQRLELPAGYTVPHVGWNNVQRHQDAPIFSRLEEGVHFYFDHSYHYVTAPEHVLATCDYGIPVTSAIRKDNICGVQFHPEKSQTAGLKLFRGFFAALEARQHA